MRTKMTPGVLVLGEVLCDLFAAQPPEPLSQTAALVPHIGGAPANVAVQLARLGAPVRLLSAVGQDPFGERLLQLLAHEGVDTSAVVIDPRRRTGVTLVEVDARGERRFFGYREGAADLALSTACLTSTATQRALHAARIVHSGTVGLRSPSSRALTNALVKAARLEGALLSLDVNLRPGMFTDVQRMLSLARGAIKRADVVKATREEAQSLVGERPDDDTLVDALLKLGPRLVLLTLAQEGALVATAAARVKVPAQKTQVVDATGAGDAFMGAALAWLFHNVPYREGVDHLSAEALTALATFACLAGSAAVTAVGATTAMLRQQAR